MVKNNKKEMSTAVLDMNLSHFQFLNEIKENHLFLLQKTGELIERVNTFDNLDIKGDTQQRLNMKIRKYAANSGLSFQQGYKAFTKAFNTAYQANLTLLIYNYKRKNCLNNLTVPQYLKKVNRLDDGLRVLDKLNGVKKK